jgi:FixJ family two-component response regulator
LINQKTPGLAILDINLGDESSETVADVLQAKGVPFIFATGYSSVKDGFKKKHSKVPVVEKPFSSSVIQAAIQSLKS